MEVFLGGSAERAACVPAELCEEGPTLAKPFEAQILVDMIRRRLAIDRKEGDS